MGKYRWYRVFTVDANYIGIYTHITMHPQILQMRYIFYVEEYVLYVNVHIHSIPCRMQFKTVLFQT